MMNTTCYRLVVCEKPSVARSIAAVLGAGRREDGFLSGGGYLISWCFGHLAELSDADAYDEKYGKWRREDLPILPDSWQYTVARDKQKQMNTLRTLMHREDVCEVINACDAGREGELIFRTAYNLNNCRKRVKRLWISSMEDAAILQGFDNLRDGAEYDNLYASALCRSKADWLVGINATRLFSVMYHRTLNVGRVVSPTLALLVQREAEINAFQPESFYTVHLDFDGFSAAGGRMKEQAEAERLAGDCNCKTAAVTSVVQTEKTEKAPALYDLTTLQRDANRLLGYTAQQTLDYLQSLYEKKLCTYPRTDSRYLTDDMEGGVNALALCCAGICGTEPPAAVCSGQVCSSKKVSDHHAVVPTMAAGETDLEPCSQANGRSCALPPVRCLWRSARPSSIWRPRQGWTAAEMPLLPKGKQSLIWVGGHTRKRASRTTLSRSFPRDSRFPFPPARSKRAERPRPNNSLRIRFCRLWRRRARRICRRMRSGAGWEPPRQGQRSLKNW